MSDSGPDDGLLVVDGLRKEFGGLVAVDDLSFGVGEGEILGLIGPNGAGKSTTFNCVMGRYPPTAGTVEYDGEDVTGESTHEMVKRGVSRTFQSFRPLDDRSVLDNVALALVPDKLFSLSGLRGETRSQMAVARWPPAPTCCWSTSRSPDWPATRSTNSPACWRSSAPRASRWSSSTTTCAGCWS